MLKNKSILGCLVAGLLLGLGPGLAAAPLVLPDDVPHRYSMADRDGDPVYVTDPATGISWSAWAYRASGEFSIALAVRSPGERWSEPVFLGLDDGLDQIEPVLAVDGWGNFYLAYTQREEGAIRMSALPVGRDVWFEPRTVTARADFASSPAMLVVRDRLVLAYRAGLEVKLLDWALLGPPGTYSAKGIQDGPDGFPLPMAETEDQDGREELPSMPPPRRDRFGRGSQASDSEEP